jgi:hypothetical protein
MNIQNYVDYFSILSHHFIIRGDYNAKHINWGCRANNPRGLVLYNYTNLKGYNILAPPGLTYWPTSLRKNPDILDIFVSNTPSNLFLTIRNLLEPTSDHTAVLLTVSSSPPIRSSPHKLFHPNTDRCRFHDLVDQNIDMKVSLKLTQEIDDAINKLTIVIQSAAWEATPTQAQISNNSSSIPEHIRFLIANKRRARVLFQQSRLPSHKQYFNSLANSLKKILTKHKNHLQVNCLTNLSPNKSLWDATKKSLKNAVPNTPLTKSDGSFTSSDADKAELLKSHLSETFSPHTEIQTTQNTKLVKQYLDSPLPLYLPTKSFTPNDVKYAIQKYSLKKSPGYDLITAEVARCLPKRAIIFLTVLFNAALRLTYFPLLWKFSIIILFHKPKKPPDLPSSYRPISLLSFFTKIFERLILKRIFLCIYSSNVLPNTQFGFRANHSTTHQLHRLVDAISLSLEKKKYCSCVFIDVSQAFDRV